MTFLNVVTIRDAGAPLSSGQGCSAIDAHSARCSWSGVLAMALGDNGDALVIDAAGQQALPSFFGPSVEVTGGDGDDRLATTTGSFGMSGDAGDDLLTGGPDRDRLDGGAGNDRLIGGAGADELDGGSGRDELYGQLADDVLLDRDLERDLLSGSAGIDTVSHSGRVEPMVADLAKGEVRARLGAPDRLRGIEGLVGGSGDDRLSGDRAENVLDGGPGLDTLSGRGDSDTLVNSEGIAACGPGATDAVRGEVSAADILGRDCELVAVGHEIDELTGELMPAHPRPANARALTFTVTCAFTEEGRERCGDGKLLVREARGQRRRIASGPLPERQWDHRRVRARLTTTGRRLVSRRGGILATVRIGNYRPFRTLRWTIRLEVAAAR
jgi:hypothetical protein